MISVSLSLLLLLLLWSRVQSYSLTLSDKVTHKEDLEFCEWESFNATCAENEVILLRAARYGRMRLGRCVTRNYGHIGCGTDVIHVFDRHCSGLQQCIVPVIKLHSKRSCPSDFKSYLTASYDCQEVAFAQKEECKFGFVTLTAPTGTLSSEVARSGGPGSSRCFWKLQGLTHQRFNITLVDLSYPLDNYYNALRNYNLEDGKVFRKTYGACKEYASIREADGFASNHTVCASTSRYAQAYVSKSPEIYVQLKPTASPDVRFLLKYKVFGCPPIEPPAHALFRGDSRHVIIQCNYSHHIYYLTCRGTQWTGERRNCSDYVPPPEINRHGDADVFSFHEMLNGLNNFPLGILIVVALGVAIGVAIGIVMLVSVLTYLRRRKRRKVRSRSAYAVSNDAPSCDASCGALGDKEISPMLLNPADLCEMQRRPQLQGGADILQGSRDGLQCSREELQCSRELLQVSDYEAKQFEPQAATGEAVLSENGEIVHSTNIPFSGAQAKSVSTLPRKILSISQRRNSLEDHKGDCPIHNNTVNTASINRTLKKLRPNSSNYDCPARCREPPASVILDQNGEPVYFRFTVAKGAPDVVQSEHH